MARKAKRFIQDNGLWTEDQQRQANDIVARLDADGIKFVRIGWGDQHGIVRGKTVSVEEFQSSLVSGKDFQLVTTLFDTTNHPIVPPFGGENDLNVPEMIGLPDGVLVPDPMTYRKLSWVPDTAWILSDAYLRSGNPCPFSTRSILRNQLGKLAGDGFRMTVGLEFEFYVFRMENPELSPEASGYPPMAPRVSMLSHGYQYLTENRGDEIEPLMRMLHDHLVGVGLPVATIEDEWGPGQCEITFSPLSAMEAADMALLFRSAVKQICRRHGYHASFMAQPQVPNVFPSGWHMHQSLTRSSDGENAFALPDGLGGPLTELGMHYVGGLLANADATSVLTTPTINGYKRQRPDGFAPFKAAWDYENRGAMVRVIGGPGDAASRVENRIGEPAANPYLYIASQIIAGRDGINQKRDPGPPARAAYLSDAPLLPNSLMTAVDRFRASDLMKQELGETFWHYLAKMKSFEIARFLSAVTDWEQQEYFEVY